jgi:hypothetical protein
MNAETAAEFDNVRAACPRQIVLKLRNSKRRKNRAGVFGEPKFATPLITIEGAVPENSFL